MSYYSSVNQYNIQNIPCVKYIQEMHIPLFIGLTISSHLQNLLQTNGVLISIYIYKYL